MPDEETECSITSLSSTGKLGKMSIWPLIALGTWKVLKYFRSLFEETTLWPYCTCIAHDRASSQSLTRLVLSSLM